MNGSVDPITLLTILISALSFYLIIPPGIPFLTPSGSFVDQLRSLNFTIGMLVAIFLYFNGFTVLESLMVGTFWSSFLLYLLMT